MEDQPRIACFATQGTGSRDEARIVTLLEALSPQLLPFRRDAKQRTATELVGQLRELRPDLVVMEGTGIAGGGAVMAARAIAGVPYVVSSGDAVAPFWGLHRRALRVPGHIYERALMTHSSGFIGWSPYLVGRALTLGAPRAMTAANWAEPNLATRNALRTRLGIPNDAIVFGLVGSLTWNATVAYAYGLELVQALGQTRRSDIHVLVVGDGDGLEHLRKTAGNDPRVTLSGRVAQELVNDHLAAIDVASLPQSVDGVGSFRYTTKLSEYLAAGLPIVTGRIPMGYDLDDGWIWRLPGTAPWDSTYINALAAMMDKLDRGEIERRRTLVPRDASLFDRERQQRRVTAFISEIVSDRR